MIHMMSNGEKLKIGLSIEGTEGIDIELMKQLAAQAMDYLYPLLLDAINQQESIKDPVEVIPLCIVRNIDVWGAGLGCDCATCQQQRAIAKGIHARYNN